MTTYTIALPSGGTAEILMSVTAGELLIAGCLIVLASIHVFNIIKDIGHLASKR